MAATRCIAVWRFSVVSSRRPQPLPGVLHGLADKTLEEAIAFLTAEVVRLNHDSDSLRKWGRLTLLIQSVRRGEAPCQT